MNTQTNYLISLLKSNPEAIIVGSLGTISYDLGNISHEHKILIKGAMGAVLGCVLGIALHTDKQVIGIIGDGSYLMKMGSISTILKYRPNNLRIIVLNNNKYQSCGGQPTNFDAIRGYIPFEVVDLT